MWAESWLPNESLLLWEQLGVERIRKSLVITSGGAERVEVFVPALGMATPGKE